MKNRKINVCITDTLQRKEEMELDAVDILLMKN